MEFYVTIKISYVIYVKTSMNLTDIILHKSGQKEMTIHCLIPLTWNSRTSKTN